jgi:hypothetical protein
VRRRAVPAVLLAIVALVVAVAIGTLSVPGEPGGASHQRAGEQRAEAVEEAEEQRETTEQRLEALRDARAAGRFGGRERVTHLATTTWAGEQVLDPRKDDWEPALAADPNAPFVYLLTTRYGEQKPCPGNCPTPFIALAISDDGGATWGPAEPLCACKGSGQFDPIVEVVPDSGHVYALWMNGFNVVFQRSTDHGETWSTPVPTWGQVSWNDKPVLATSDDGQEVYVSWNGPTSGDPWVAQSHDGGATWSQRKLVDSARYFFAMDAEVLPDGTAILSESSFDYSGPGGAAVGEIRHHAFISRDDGATWEEHLLDTVQLGEPCESAGCYDDFYAGHTTVTADADGDVVFAYDGAVTALGPQLIKVKRSSDEGRTWSGPVTVSSGRMATAPVAEATGDGDVRLWFAERRPTERWNIWAVRSSDGGATWSSPIRISDATSGARYKTADGFLEFYGDYGEMAITSSGATIAAWGEGFSWTGPGGVWFNRET